MELALLHVVRHVGEMGTGRRLLHWPQRQGHDDATRPSSMAHGMGSAGCSRLALNQSRCQAKTWSCTLGLSSRTLGLTSRDCIDGLQLAACRRVLHRPRHQGAEPRPRREGVEDTAAPRDELHWAPRNVLQRAPICCKRLAMSFIRLLLARCSVS